MAIANATSNPQVLSFAQVVAQTPYSVYVVVGDSAGNHATSNSITVTVNPPPTYTLTLQQVTGGTISSAQTVYNSGDTAVITATPSSGYLLSGWLVDGVAYNGTTLSINLTMNSNHTVQAVFALQSVTCILTLAQSTGGTISSGATVYNSGTTATVTATPNAGYILTGWLMDGVSYDGTTNPLSFVMNNNHTIQAVFSLTTPPSGFNIANFNDSTIWATTTGGTGAVQSATATSVKLACPVASDFAGLRTVKTYDLTAGDIIVNIDRISTRTALIVSTLNVADPLAVSSGWNMYGLIRDGWYGLEVYNGSGFPYVGADPVASSTPAQLRITFANGVVSFYYNGTLLYSEASHISPTSLYVYVMAYATSANGTTVGTDTVTSTGYVPPLTVTISPSTNQSISTNASLTFTATATGDTPPYTIHWLLDGVDTGQTGTTYVFHQTTAKNYTVQASVTDSTNATASSNTVTVTVSAIPPPTITVSPTSANLTSVQTQTFTATAMSGTAPYTITWIDDSNGATLGTGTTYVFPASSAGTYSIHAHVVDSMGQSADSASVIITVIAVISGTTPWSQALDAGTYEITVPAQVTVSGVTYSFLRWEDGSTTNPRTLTLSADTTITATYQASVPALSASANGPVHSPHDEPHRLLRWLRIRRFSSLHMAVGLRRWNN